MLLFITSLGVLFDNKLYIYLIYIDFDKNQNANLKYTLTNVLI